MGYGSRRILGSEGSTAQIQQLPGSIGYLEYAFSVQNQIQVATLENKSGRFVEPTINSFTQALNNTTLPDNLRVFITDPVGADSYPIVAYTWLLVYKKYDDPDKAATLKYLLNWSLTEGQRFASPLGYVPLPPRVIRIVREKVNQTL
ncbi:hypothetical protein DSM106972_094560 [Dulcicalothrix desertica PCC 7102]|uniref:PBP domain-containing protein n=1 Tax=Dulcicalothrix desertica PCC 7102 TaxID=232991 RepID=A0A433UJG2_9CYAN|nr:substrate-binding domain-containing protein [Dulcicalothrix desertica]RUS93985.1 hypothetical protein DSM106972_094560 [Dulcicalothrix desertica PCC 7102]